MKNYLKTFATTEPAEKNYTIAGYIVAGFITVSGIFYIYEMLFNGDMTFQAEWNMFKSAFGNLCMGIGLIMAIVWWGKFTHWSARPMVEVRDKSNNLLASGESNDVTDQLFAKVILPLLGHFVIEPLIYAAIIYYPIQCIVAIVGAIFPYILTLIILCIIALAWMFTRLFHFRYQTVVLVLAGVLLTGAFAWGGYDIHSTAFPTESEEFEYAGYDSDFDEAVADDMPDTDEEATGEGINEAEFE